MYGFIGWSCLTTTISAAGAAVTLATGATKVLTDEEVAQTLVTTGGALAEVTAGGTLTVVEVLAGWQLATGTSVVNVRRMTAVDVDNRQVSAATSRMRITWA